MLCGIFFFSTQMSENNLRAGELKHRTEQGFVLTVTGEPRPAFLQPPLHPTSTPAVLAGGGLPHGAGSTANRKTF